LLDGNDSWVYKVVNDINEIDQDDINLKNEGFNLNKILPKGCCGI